METVQETELLKIQIVLVTNIWHAGDAGRKLPCFSLLFSPAAVPLWQ